MDLGEAPFKCCKGCKPQECPDGYECKGDSCVKKGTCPDSVAGCKCGNGQCDPGENNETCPSDCPVACGNGQCDSDETSTNCPGDCPAGTCGDGTCDAGESSTSCSKDCPAASCGNGTCEVGETNQSCATDCPGGICGNGKCDAGEVVTCPTDCATCTANATQCEGTESLKLCQNGTWKTQSCDARCKAEGYDYSAGCAFSPVVNKDACSCGKSAGFGSACDDKQKCSGALFCGTFGGDVKGFCTKYCSNPGGACAGAPSGTSAQCNLELQGQYVCGFECGYSIPCPTGLTCDFFDDVCKP
jgi:hypothetical protein